MDDTRECQCKLRLQPPVVSFVLLLVTLMQRDSMKLITSRGWGGGGSEEMAVSRTEKMHIAEPDSRQ